MHDDILFSIEFFFFYFGGIFIEFTFIFTRNNPIEIQYLLRKGAVRVLYDKNSWQFAIRRSKSPAPPDFKQFSILLFLNCSMFRYVCVIIPCQVTVACPAALQQRRIFASQRGHRPVTEHDTLVFTLIRRSGLWGSTSPGSGPSRQCEGRVNHTLRLAARPCALLGPPCRPSTLTFTCPCVRR